MLPMSLEQRLEIFEAEWSPQDSNRLKSIVDEVERVHRAEFLAELIMIDLEQRDRSDDDSSNTQHTLSEYFEQFSDDLSDESIRDKIKRHVRKVCQRSQPVGSNRERTNASLLSTKESSPNPANGNAETGLTPQVPPATLLGRYRIEKKLGAGHFGTVFLAYDEQLRRLVAVKIPHDEIAAASGRVESHLQEARTVAALDHPNIVPVYDVGNTPDCPCFIVSKFIDGQTLTQRLNETSLGWSEIADLTATIAQALHYAHSQGLVHRDIKPGNILLDNDGKPHVVDFGLALRQADPGAEMSDAGTPAYMSPEQVRGEGHRLDGRSDLFSLGVLLYELLTGERPFFGGTVNETLFRVTMVDPSPPRVIRPAVPAELERICLKCLSKKASSRYSTAGELAEELLSWDKEETGLPAKRDIISPKGLRSFDASDADYYLDLLPGPKSRQGLPESIQFWKTRIEQRESDLTFSVGLLYGPSGCGKSSLVKAGLIPHLSPQVTVVYVEATYEDTEQRLLSSLRGRHGWLPEDKGLVDSLKLIRLRENSKTVLILDQFEQWLHVNETAINTELIDAIRHCDGENLQALFMVRDDFAMAAARVMDALDIPIVQGHNFATVDLFDIAHARKLLMRFGQAFGQLPEDDRQLSADQNEFLDLATSGLSNGGKVISVRLALFAEMVKNSPWTQTTLKKVGGTTGVGVNFLEETFAGQSANPTHLRHEKAARHVLRALLPEIGTNIKGCRRSYDELLSVSGLQERQSQFDELLQVLDRDLRLITPSDPDENQSDQIAKKNVRSYQLTHDYLVHALRVWLNRKQLETAHGRAELKLSERTELWTSKPENRHLPNVAEWLNIRLLTDARRWSDSEQAMMKKAARVHLTTWGTVAMFVLVAAVLLQQFISSVRHSTNLERTQTTVSSLQGAEGAAIPLLLATLEELPRDVVVDELTRKNEAATGQPKLALAYGLAHFEQVHPYEIVSLFIDEAIPPTESENVVRALRHDKDKALDALGIAADRMTKGKRWEEKARLAVVAMYLGDATLAQQMLKVEPDNTSVKRYTSNLRDVLLGQSNTAAVSQRDDNAALSIHLTRATALHHLDRPQQAIDALDRIDSREQGNPDVLLLKAICLSRVGNKEQALTTVRELSESGGIAQYESANILVPGWDGEIDRAIQELDALVASDPTDSATLYRAAGYAAQLVKASHLHQPTATEKLLTRSLDLLQKSLEYDYYSTRLPQTDFEFLPIHDDARFVEFMSFALPMERACDPTQRTVFISEFPPWSFKVELLEPIAKQIPEADFRSGMGLALGGLKDPGRKAKEAWGSRLANWYFNAGESGTHSASQWCLKQWGLSVPNIAITQRPEPDRDWWHTEPDMTLLRVPTGSVTASTWKGGKRTARVFGEFWLSDREVTLGQFKQFLADESYQGIKPRDWKGPLKSEWMSEPKFETLPVHNVTWYEALMFCNWLSHEHGLQPCYLISAVTDQADEYTVSIDVNGNGYRLPTPEQWEFACRTWTTTRFSFGDSNADLQQYAFYDANSDSRVQPTGTKRCNAWGFFDMHGNVWELASSGHFRGGSCWDPVRICESSFVDGNSPSHFTANLGFRVALPITPVSLTDEFPAPP